jgi:pilus assembly protein Flp/PilA
MILRHLIENDRGVTAIEYGLIAALIAVAAIAMITSVGTNLTNTFSTVAAVCKGWASLSTDRCGELARSKR